MYKITLILQNPVTGDAEQMVYQFDPATLNQTKWNGAFPAVAARLTILKDRATPIEPPTW